MSEGALAKVAVDAVREERSLAGLVRYFALLTPEGSLS